MQDANVRGGGEGGGINNKRTNACRGYQGFYNVNSPNVRVVVAVVVVTC